MKNLILIPLLIVLILTACDDTEKNQADAETTAQDSTQLADETSETVSPLIGKWELVEKRIPDIGAIPLGNIFYTFDTDGKVLSEHNDNSDVAPEKSDYLIEGAQLQFNETTYEIISLEGDTLHLQSNTDGITENSLLIRR